MKTIELSNNVERLGLETAVDDFDILIVDKEGQTICSINRNKRFQLDTDWNDTELIIDVIKEELLRIVCQYASTPIEEREIEPKYKLALRKANKWFVEDFHCVFTKKEWEDELKVSWETITSIYQPIMID